MLNDSHAAGANPADIDSLRNHHEAMENASEDYIMLGSKASDNQNDVEFSFHPSEQTRENFRSHLVKLASFQQQQHQSNSNDHFGKFFRHSFFLLLEISSKKIAKNKNTKHRR
jgi:hypothetical protein